MIAFVEPPALARVGKAAVLFRAHVLRALFFFAILGVLAELLTWTRRTRVSASARLRSRPHAYRAALGGLFALQVALGYALMLIAMTYQARAAVRVGGFAPGLGSRPCACHG